MKEIVQDGAEVLRATAKVVPEKMFGTPELTRIIEDMKEALDVEPEGVALAAPQIAVPYRIFIIRKDRTLPPPLNAAPGAASGELPAPQEVLAPQIEVYINPDIKKTSRKKVHVDEGCLSCRGVYGTTKRHERATIRARNVDGARFERSGGGIMAQIFEHEIDHLNGTLFIDHAERLIHIPHGSVLPFIFFGTPTVASDTLAILIERGFVPTLIVTSPDAPAGRGLALTPSPVKALALEKGIPVLTPEKLTDDVIASIQEYACDYALCVAYGKIFPEALINAFSKGVLNVHYSLLPKYRGATPLEGALLAGEAETGVTIQKMVKELDAGDIIAQKHTPIAPEETARELRPRLIELGAILLADTLPAYLSDAITPTPQDATHASHSGKLQKEDGLLSLADSAEKNWNKYRAYADSVGTYFFKNNKRMKIIKASFKNGTFTIERIIPEGKNETSYQSATSF